MIQKFFLKKLTAEFQDVTENANWNKCIDDNGASLARCIYHCNNDSNCEASCIEQFKIRTNDCPCEVSPCYHRSCLVKIGKKTANSKFRRIVLMDVHVIHLNAKMLLQQSLQQLWYHQLQQNQCQKNGYLCSAQHLMIMFRW